MPFKLNNLITMRILIDLQDCQLAQHSSETMDHPLWLLTQALIDLTQHTHEVWILLNNQLPDTIDPIAYHLRHHIPAVHIYMCDIPLPEATPLKTSWFSAAHALVLQQCVTDINPDFILFSQPALTLLTTLPTHFNDASMRIGAALLPNPSLINSFKSSPTLHHFIQLILLPTNASPPPWITDPSIDSPSFKIVSFPTTTIEKTTWETTATKCLTAFESCSHPLSSQAPSILVSKPKLAYLATTFTHQQWLVDLTDDYAITFITVQEAADLDRLNSPAISIASLPWFLQQAHQFDQVLYHLANTPDHLPLLHALIQYPGIVMTDDVYFDQLYSTHDEAITRYHAQGYWALQHPQRPAACQHQIFSHAVGIITHDPNWIELYQRQYPQTSLPTIRIVADWHQAALTHNPTVTPCATYREAIDFFAQHGAQTMQRKLLTRLAQLSTEFKPSKRDTLTLASCLANHFNPWQAPQLLIDISLLDQEQTKTGIGRVLSSITRTLLTHPPENYRVEPVYHDRYYYRYARRLTAQLLDIELPASLADDGIDLQANDIFLVFDIHPQRLKRNEPLYRRWKNRGVKLYFVIYDLIPYLRPEVFEPQISIEFQQWLTRISQISSGLICDSQAVADELRLWLQQNNPQRCSPLNVGYFHLGADIDASFPSHKTPNEAQNMIQAMKKKPSFIMVSTLEPRKGHAQALAAFNQLWQESMEVNLIIIGKQGWLVDALVQQIQQHPQLNHRLFWLGYVSDEFLDQLYAHAAALLVASEAEGFGLPLIEAARHHLPLLIRDLPVFREIAKDHAFYFRGLTSEDLANAIKNWLGLFKQGSIPTSSEMPWLTWQASAQQLLRILSQQHWYFTHSCEPNNLTEDGVTSL